MSNPSILFLDEPTSGLDAGTDRRMMQLFAELAGDGKTVVCITHTLENIDLCDLVAILFRGRLVYFGRPVAVADYFGIRKASDVYEKLETAPPDQWAQRYQGSPPYHEYVSQRLAAKPAPVQDRLPVTDLSTGSKDGRRFDWHQTRVLSHRCLDLMVSDRRNLLLQLAQAPIIGLVIGSVFDTSGPPAAPDAAEGLSAIWLGCLNSAREIVKELPVYLRERSVNLEVGPYLISKLIPLAGLCALQSSALLAVVSRMVSIPGSFVERAVAIFLTEMAAVAMGLTVSALVNTPDKAIGIIPILLIPQVILSEAIVNLPPARKSRSFRSSPSWAMTA